MKTNKRAGRREQEKRPSRRLWTVRSALAAVPYLKRVVTDMREAYCRLAHARRMHRKDPHNGYLQADLKRAEQEVAAHQLELDEAGVLAYQHYARGILLLPALKPGHGESGLADRKSCVYLIWRDTRPGVPSYCEVDELHRVPDLIRCEREVPASWGKV